MTTKIEWTEETWNPVRGCTRISPGCGGPHGEGGCYAERDMARKNSNPKVPGCHGFAEFVQINGKSHPRWTGRVELIPEKLTEPLHWRKPRRVFVNSMSDLFHESLSDEAIERVFAVMALCPQHTFQVLTKRAKRMREWAQGAKDRIKEEIAFQAAPWSAHSQTEGLGGIWCAPQIDHEGRVELRGYFDDIDIPWPLPNVHLGVSVESQKYADERIPELLATPAAVRWVSAEPLLEAVDFARVGDMQRSDGTIGKDVLHRYQGSCEMLSLDWLVVGGESGPGARPFDLAWGRSIIAQCRAAGVPVFFKQAGANVIDSAIDPGEHGSRHRKAFFSRKGGDPQEWPEDLRVREYPR